MRQVRQVLDVLADLVPVHRDGGEEAGARLTATSRTSPVTGKAAARDHGARRVDDLARSGRR